MSQHTPAAAAAVLALVLSPLGALAQTADPPATDSEISAIRAQISGLTQRLDRLEAARAKAAAGAAAPTAKVPAAPASPSVRTAASTPSAAEAAATLSASTAGKVAPGPADHALKGATPAFEIATDQKSSKVSATFSHARAWVNFPGDGATGYGTSETSSITLTSPLGKDGDRTTFATLSSLADSTSLAFSKTWFWQKLGKGGQDQAGIAERARKACRAAPKGGDASVCEDDATGSFVLYYDKSEYDAYMFGYFPNAPAWAAGVDGGVGYRQFTFLNAATGASQDTDRAPWNLGGHASLFSYDGTQSLTGTISYQYGFKAQKTAALCPAPVAGAARTKCAVGPVGKPGKDYSYQASLEYRHILNLANPALPAWMTRIGIAPQVTYDFDKDVTAVDFPIYLIPNSKGGLLGGLRLGYSTEDHKTVVGAFIGAPLSIF
jgi:hypothetical protein